MCKKSGWEDLLSRQRKHRRLIKNKRKCNKQPSRSPPLYPHGPFKPRGSWRHGVSQDQDGGKSPGGEKGFVIFEWKKGWGETIPSVQSQWQFHLGLLFLNEFLSIFNLTGLLSQMRAKMARGRGSRIVGQRASPLAIHFFCFISFTLNRLLRSLSYIFLLLLVCFCFKIHILLNTGK